MGRILIREPKGIKVIRVPKGIKVIREWKTDMEALEGDYFVCKHQIYDMGWIPPHIQKYEFSFQTLDFLVNYVPNQFPSPMYPNMTKLIQRNIKIARRMGCYKPPLLNELHMLTDPNGINAYKEAKYVYDELKAFYTVKEEFPIAEDITKERYLNKIVPNGTFPLTTIKMLKLLYTLQHNPINLSSTTTAMNVTGRPDLHAVTHEGQAYIKASYTQQHKHMRITLDTLIKFGLAEAVRLTKTSLGRGRAPVGVTITEVGERFHDLFFMKFHLYPDLSDM